ncbi:MAG: 50S ribosomal protein L30 [Bacteroidaceae bacterium]|nr:50S ribosomal protein L30 [Bacteroidaceae bacterium]
MTKVKITQVISTNGATERQKANLHSLGIHKIHHSVETELDPIKKGMLDKVRHLVTVEEVK